MHIKKREIFTKKQLYWKTKCKVLLLILRKNYSSSALTDQLIVQFCCLPRSWNNYRKLKQLQKFYKFVLYQFSSSAFYQLYFMKKITENLLFGSLLKTEVIIQWIIHGRWLNLENLTQFLRWKYATGKFRSIRGYFMN